MVIGGVFGLVLFALWVYSLFEVIVTEEPTVRGLPKMAWVMIVLFGGPFGALAWLFLGPRRRRANSSPQPPTTRSPAPPTRRRPVGPEDSPEFMADLERKRREQERHRRRRDGGVNGAEPTPSE